MDEKLVEMLTNLFGTLIEEFSETRGLFEGLLPGKSYKDRKGGK